MASHPVLADSLTRLDERFATKASSPLAEARQPAAVMTASATATSSIAIVGDDAKLLIASQVEAQTPPASWAEVFIEGTSKLACSHFHILARGRGAVYSWGRGPLGVLGHGTEVDEQMPRRIDSLDDKQVLDLSCGPYHSACTTSDGKLLLWGWEAYGTMDDGGLDETFTTAPRPISLGSATRVRGVSCGCFATAAWDASGQLYTWGRGECGQLGHGTYDSVALPRPVESLMGVRVAQVAFGGIQSHEGHTGFMLVRSSSGAAFTCGSPVRGRLGRPFTISESDRDNEYHGNAREEPVHHALPGQILGVLTHGRRGKTVPIARVAAADSHAAIISDSGALYVWGADDAGVLGQAAENDAAKRLEEVTCHERQ